MKKQDLLAALVVVVFGGPLAFMLTSAFADGEVRRHEMPLRAMLGDQAYESLARGENSNVHYMGNERLVPDFELRDEAGNTFSMRDMRGRVVVLNFWTTTCGPCIEEMPNLVQLSRILGDRDDIELVSISTDRTWDEIHTVLPPNSEMRVLLDADRSVVRGRFGTRMYPETWIIDPHGAVRLRIDGARDWSSAVALDLFESYL